MKTDRIMILGNKESFFIRVLVKKIAEEDIDSFFCPAEVDAIDKNFENVSLADELEYIRNYILLVNLRYDFEVILSVNVPKELMSERWEKIWPKS